MDKNFNIKEFGEIIFVWLWLWHNHQDHRVLHTTDHQCKNYWITSKLMAIMRLWDLRPHRIGCESYPYADLHCLRLLETNALHKRYLPTPRSWHQSMYNRFYTWTVKRAYSLSWKIYLAAGGCGSDAPLPITLCILRGRSRKPPSVYFDRDSANSSAKQCCMA